MAPSLTSGRSRDRKNFRAYRDKDSVTDLHEFPGWTHYTCSQKGWEDVAEYILIWLKKFRPAS